MTLTAAVLLDRRRAELAEAEERTGLSVKRCVYTENCRSVIRSSCATFRSPAGPSAR